MSGLKSGSSSSLMKMAAPFLMGIIGKQASGKGIGFLKDMLMGQKEHVAAAMPSGMGKLLGLGSLLGGAKDALGSVSGAATGAVSGAANVAGNTANTLTGAVGNAAGAVTGATSNAASAVSGAAGNVAGAAGDAAKSGLGWIKWALPFLIIGGLAWWFFTGENPKDALGSAGDAIGNVADKTGDLATDAAGAVGDAANATGDVLGEAANATGEAVGDAAGAVGNFAKGAFATVNEAGKAALDKITFTTNSAGSQMMEYIDGGFEGDGRVTFRNLNFASGSDKISGNSGVEVDNLAAILKAYPDVKINVAGYTDSTGNAESNKTLSENRAKSVKQRLMDAGVSPSRVATQGFGAANPVASNDTKEGQAQNRRIEVTIAK